MEYFDFQIRAWRADDGHADVMVHSSPAGDMPRPVSVACDFERLNELRNVVKSHWQGGCGSRREMIRVGRELAAIILCPPVFMLLIRSRERIENDDGLRLRLCLDE